MQAAGGPAPPGASPYPTTSGLRPPGSGFLSPGPPPNAGLRPPVPGERPPYPTGPPPPPVSQSPYPTGPPPVSQSPYPGGPPPPVSQSPYPTGRPSATQSPFPPGRPPANQSPYPPGRPSANQSPYPAGPPPPPGGRQSLPPASSVYPTPQTNNFRPPGHKKRLVVCCDGTWLDSDSSLMKHEVQIPSNVTRLGRAVKPESSDGVTQIVFYQPGVGTEGGAILRAAGGATAEGLAGNIREAYSFICQNYAAGDELFLVGFSRGAFTARSVAGLITTVGLLTKAGQKDLGIIFKDVEHRNNPNYISPYPDTPFPRKPSASDPKYARELARRELSQLQIPIKAIAVWDTVGSLGIPRIPWLERLGLQRRAVKEYTFYDTALGTNVEYAFQALALDEHRASFVPTLWEKPRRREGATDSTVLRQVWFPGVHSNVGGGYPDPGLADITFAWMIAQLEPLLDFSGPYLAAQAAAAVHYYDFEAPSPQRNRPWSFGYIYRSMTGLYALAGRATRTPGEYTRLDPETGRPTKSKLRDTCEYIHASVRARTTLAGPGPEDRGDYAPPALDHYTLRRTGDAPGGSGPPAVWESTARRKNGNPRRVLLEAPMFNTEMRLLGASPEVEQALFGTAPAARPLGAGRPPRRGDDEGRRPARPEGSRRRHRRGQSSNAPEAALVPEVTSPSPDGGPAAGGSGRRRRRRSTSQ